MEVGAAGEDARADPAREGADCAHRDDGGVAPRLAWQARRS